MAEQNSKQQPLPPSQHRRHAMKNIFVLFFFLFLSIRAESTPCSVNVFLTSLLYRHNIIRCFTKARNAIAFLFLACRAHSLCLDVEEHRRSRSLSAFLDHFTDTYFVSKYTHLLIVGAAFPRHTNHNRGKKSPNNNSD